MTLTALGDKLHRLPIVEARQGWHLSSARQAQFCQGPESTSLPVDAGVGVGSFTRC